MLTCMCPATVVVDGNKTKDLSHVEAGLKRYVPNPFSCAYHKELLTDKAQRHAQRKPPCRVPVCCRGEAG